MTEPEAVTIEHRFDRFTQVGGTPDELPWGQSSVTFEMTPQECGRYLRETGYYQPSVNDLRTAYYGSGVEPTSDDALQFGHKTLTHISDQFRRDVYAAMTADDPGRCSCWDSMEQRPHLSHCCWTTPYDCHTGP